MKGKQDKHLDFVGRFESPVNVSIALEGRLVRRQKGLRLETTPTFSSPLSTAGLRDSLSTALPEARWDVLHGRTSDGLCSLLYTQPRQDPSTFNFSEDYSVDWRTYSVNSVLSDVHLSDVEGPCITGARLEFEQLRPWLKQSLRISRSEKETSIAAPRLEPAFVDFSAYPSRIRYQLEAESILCVNHEQGAIFQKKVVVKLSCIEPISYVEFRKAETRLQDFLSILMGISISASKIQLIFGEETGYLFRRRIRERPQPYLPIWIRPDRIEIAVAWATWLQLGDELEPFERLLYGTVQNSRMFVEIEFQALAQSLEAFHRLTVEGRFYAKSRLHALLSRLLPDNAARLVGDSEQFVLSVVDTRDVLAHPGIVKPHAISGAKELFLTNQKMHALLRLLVLKRLGMSEEHAFQPCREQASRYS